MVAERQKEKNRSKDQVDSSLTDSNADIEKMVQCSNHYARPVSLEEPPEEELELVRKVVEIGGGLFNEKSYMCG